jgi:hypothetical protein
MKNDKIIVFFHKNKEVNIMYPTIEALQKYGGFDNWAERELIKIQKGYIHPVTKENIKDSLADLDYEVMKISDLPEDNKNRNAWEGSKGQGIKVNKAKVLKNKNEQLIQKKILETQREQAIIELKKEKKIK